MQLPLTRRSRRIQSGLTAIVGTHELASRRELLSFYILKNKVVDKSYLCDKFIFVAPIAQLVEQLPLKEMVLGSNPSGRTRSKKQTALLFRTLVRAGAIFC